MVAKRVRNFEVEGRRRADSKVDGRKRGDWEDERGIPRDRGRDGEVRGGRKPGDCLCSLFLNIYRLYKQ